MSAGTQHASTQGMVHAELARAGCRMTSQRKAIVAEFVRSRRYLTPQELYQRLSAHRPPIGLATVYRTLEVLERIGAASRAPHAHGEAAYLFCQPAQHHHHAVCTQCGRVDDVPCGSVDRFARTLAHNLRFQLRQHRMEFYGLCRSCAEA